MENNIFRHKLSNELEIMAIEKPNTSLFLIEMIVKVGSSVLFQNKDEIECAHFLEHFNARFTSTKYPNYKENIHKFDFNGITYNASTSDEETRYWLYGHKDNKELILDILLNSYADFKIDEASLEQEREAIINELYMSKSNYDKNNYNNLTKIYKYSYDIDDRINSTKTMTIKKLKNFRDKYYCSHNTKILIIGDISHENIFNYITLYFENNKVKKHDIIIPEYNVPLIDNNIFYNKKIDSENTSIFITFALDINIFNVNYYTTIYISNILRQRLHRYLRDDAGKVYGVGVNYFAQHFNKLNFLIISTSIREKNNIISVYKIIFDQINRMILGDISESRYLKAQNGYRVDFLKQDLNNDFGSLMNQYVNEYLYDKKLLSKNDELNNMMSVTLNDIKKLSKEILNPKNIIINNYGKYNLIKEIKVLLSQNYII